MILERLSAIHWEELNRMGMAAFFKTAAFVSDTLGYEEETKYP